MTGKERFGVEQLQLRKYQNEGVNWMAFNWQIGRNSILCDEMGLGKTAQIATLFHFLFKKRHAPGIFNDIYNLY